MRRMLIKWWYRRKYQQAYATLEKLVRRHKDAGHEVHFSAVNEASLNLYCHDCPELQPLRRKAEDVVHISVDHLGRPYR